MKVFRELYLHLPEEKADDFFSELEQILQGNWRREISLEQKSARESKVKFYYFSCGRTEVLEPALIAFARKNPEIVYISNIVPRERGKLSKDQYNVILMEFYNNFLQPLCSKYSVPVETTSDNQSMEDWVSEETYRKLKSFSRTANKSTGTSHPCDQERWFAFIVSALRHNESLDSSRLKRWLVEEEGWHEDMAFQLAIEYEQGLSLLTYSKNYQNEHQSVRNR